MDATSNRRRLLKAALAGSAAVAAGPRFIRDLCAQDVIRIAGIHDATGRFGLYGRPMIDALTLAVEELNAAGGLLGRDVTLINFDPQSDMDKYALCAAQAATQEKAAVVFGGITSPSREAIRPVLKRLDTLYFYNTLYEGGVCDRNCFCTGSTPAQTVEKLIPYAMKRFNGKKVYVLAADFQYGQITAKWIKKYVLENGGTVVQTDFFAFDTADFGPTIRKIQAARPDIVMSVLVGSVHLPFYRQWAAADMKNQIPMASTTFGIGNEHIATDPAEHNGILACYAYFQDLKSAANVEFVERYRKRFGDRAAALAEPAIMTWHGFQLWAAGVRIAGTVERSKVIEALETNLGISGPAGTTTIDAATHHVILDVHLAEAQNRRFKVLESFSQQKPADTAAVCDLKKNPDDNQQYVISVKV